MKHIQLSLQAVVHDPFTFLDDNISTENNNWITELILIATIRRVQPTKPYPTVTIRITKVIDQDFYVNNFSFEELSAMLVPVYHKLSDQGEIELRKLRMQIKEQAKITPERVIITVPVDEWNEGFSNNQLRTIEMRINYLMPYRKTFLVERKKTIYLESVL